ncbi:MAG: valine--tRNA ligase [Candidatus Zixiibacteriota bacterium]
MKLEKIYDPQKSESHWLKSWFDNGYFSPKPDNREHYSIVIPPPNVTDVLHLGHALNNIIQDVLIRYHRAKGLNTLWLPGTDHAGIATQNMVERQLAKKNKRKEEIGRKAFSEMLWAWKEKKGGRILKQLKELGASCDFNRTRFTMDEGFSNAVKEVFIRLHEQDLIYRGNYIINWCPRCGTALADDEVEHQEENGKLWHMKYPYKHDKNKFVTVATTRPETMLGDTAVAVHPDDERYKDLVGKTVILPIIEREIPIVADTHVDPEFGTGAVKITPAHDPDDFEVGNRHKLDRIKVIGEDGKMTALAGDKIKGMDRYEARKKVVEIFDKLGLLVGIDEHKHAVGHCYRCDTTIEPFLSNQWFVRMKPLSEPAIALVRRRKVRIHPKRWEGVYFNWMNNIKDWCISRQLWWGHRMPVYWCDSCGKYTVAREMPEECPYCGAEELRQDENVLDTWFSSWLWPFATMGWPDYESEDLKAFFPTNALSTANEIIFFWVARMIMASIHFTGEIPFKDVYIHGTVRDEKGRKMSKSLGNGIDPLDVIDKYGRDSLRFTMLYQAAAGQDIFISMDSFEEGRNFTNKLWNSARFLLDKVEGSYKIAELSELDELEPEDEYILSKLHNTIYIVSKNIDQFNLAESIKAIYSFFWAEFCDWYLEMIKPRFGQDESSTVEKVALNCFYHTLIMLQPFTPFVAEELFQKIKAEELLKDLSESITIEHFPDSDGSKISEDAEKDFEMFKQIVGSVRNIKASFGIAGQKSGELHIVAPDDDAKYLDNLLDDLRRLARLDNAVLSPEKPDGLCGNGVIGKVEIYLPLGDIIDVEKELNRIEKEIKHVESMIKSSESKLANENFVNRAPEEIVNGEKKKLEDLKIKQNKLISQKESMKKY